MSFLLALLLSMAHIQTFADDFDDELSVEEESLDADFGDENQDVSFDDFADKPAADKPAEEAPPTDEVQLEPLTDDLEKTTEVPVVPETPTQPEIAAPQESYPETVQTPDEPDMAWEARLHDIYVNFYASKTSNEQWAALVGDRESEDYKIMPGDTLWGISKTLFNDGNYWPKIWSLNDDITNPHLIRKGNSVRFLMGNEAEPPAFAVSESGPQGDAEPTLSEIKTSTGDTVELPPPLDTYRPVLKKIPPSLPQWQNNNQTGNYDELGIDYGRRPILDVSKSAYLLSYIADQPETFTGKIIEIETGGEVAGEDQYVFIQLPQGQGQAGQIYVARENAGKIKAENKSIDETNLGVRIDNLGEIKLIDIVQARVDKGHEAWRAYVTKAIHFLPIGAGLHQGRLETYQSDEMSGPRSNVVAQVIGGAYDNRRTLFAAQSTLFINRGENDGLAIGQILPLRANQKLRNPKTLIEENIRPIGYIRIIKTAPNFATGIVVKAFENIVAGDLTGQGSLLGRVSADENAFGIEDLPGDAVEEQELDNEFDDPEFE